jgi:ABC-2 type transport system ATP-binding protein
MAGRIRGGDRADVVARTEELIADLELGEWRDVVGAKLSGGVRRLVGFAMTIVEPGRLVILDEPTNDVDPRRRRLLWERIRRLGDEDVAVILVTHNVLEAEKSVDRLAIIDGGEVVAEGTPSSLKAGDRALLRLQVMLTPGSESPELPNHLRTEARVGNTLITLVAEPDVPASLAWAQDLMAVGVAEEYALGATSLEDVYVRLTTAAPTAVAS